MNRLYKLKSFVLVVAFLAFADITTAQNFTLDPGNVVNETIMSDGFVEPEVDAINNLSTNLILDYELVSNTLNPAWEILVCDNINCYVGAVADGTMDPIAAGEREMIFKVTFDPKNVTGIGSISYAVWDQNDLNSIDTVTFNFTVEQAVSITSEQLDAQVKLFPQPSEDVMHISFNASLGKVNVEIFTLSGSIVKRQDVSDPSELINVSDLAPGIYVLHLSTDIGVVNKRILIQ